MTTVAWSPLPGGTSRAAQPQRCQAHFSRNVLGATPKAAQKELKTHLTALFTAPDLATARTLLRQMHTLFAECAPTALEILDAGFDDATAVLALPAPYRVRLRTTNSQERKSEEIRRRERVIRIFPNRPAAVRLLGALLMEWDEQWATGKRYLDMDLYLQTKQHHQHTLTLETAGKEVPAQVA